ncbi:MAG: DNA polymerase/3'-5' exonuclease PolX [Patescibacteria group bacterium]|nr:DNA polymerase/3'-5' exonuclease PolX [Patescibacteria group bacterium]MDD5490358.1 DNA polymerase/3'-5' exonuclease PolX [Patescibacteria group bacterium]
MINQQLAQIFYNVADYLEMDEIPFKPRAYAKAAQFLESLDESAEDVYNRGGVKALEALPAIGASMARKIEEYIKTGKVRYYNDLRRQIPIKIEELTAVEGVGPRVAKELYRRLKITDLASLEKAARAGKIHRLPGFKEKSEENILRGVEFLKKSKGRKLLGQALPLAREIESRLNKLGYVKKAAVAGSVRRRKETIGDFDFVAASGNPEKAMDFFVSLPEVAEIHDKGKTLSSVRLNNGLDADLRVVRENQYGSVLHHFTGDKYHNIALRSLAKSRGLKISEYGVFRGSKCLASRTEKDVYATLGLPYIEPELRVNNGEIEAAAAGKLPKLISYKDIRGDLQLHTNWTDGHNSLEEMVMAAKKIGYEYIAITDHTKYLAMANGLDEKRILKYIEAIKKINRRLRGMRVLAGVEVNILKDGNLDIENSVLNKLDIVLAGVHSHFNQSGEEMTRRMERAMRNPNVDVIVHPSGRVLQRREGYAMDWPRVFKTAENTGTILEINAHFNRLDMEAERIREAVRAGVKLEISTDAHSVDHLWFMELGIAEARKGWARKEDVINTYPLGEMLKLLK